LKKKGTCHLRKGEVPFPPILGRAPAILGRGGAMGTCYVAGEIGMGLPYQARVGEGRAGTERREAGVERTRCGVASR